MTATPSPHLDGPPLPTDGWTPQMRRILAEALSLPPRDLSALVGEILASAPRQVLDDAREQLEANR